MLVWKVAKRVKMMMNLGCTCTSKQQIAMKEGIKKGGSENKEMAEEGVSKIKLGYQGLQISAQELRCMGMSAFYGPPKPESDMIELIQYVIDVGITLLNASDVYGPFTNEITLKGGARGKVVLATKFGIHYGAIIKEVRGDPEYVRKSCEESLKRLDIDCVDIYYLHRVDTHVPIEVTIGELKKLHGEGKIKYIGLSEASASTIRRAHSVHPISAVQIEWSLWSRDVEEDIIPTCRELGIGIVAYNPLGRGFLSSRKKFIESLAQDDFRRTNLRFQSEALKQNELIYERVSELASKKGCIPSQLSLAWVHHQGITKIENLKQNIGALSIKLIPEEMAFVESFASADAVKGDKYAQSMPTWKQSETPDLS